MSIKAPEWLLTGLSSTGVERKWYFHTFIGTHTHITQFTIHLQIHTIQLCTDQGSGINLNLPHTFRVGYTIHGLRGY